MKNLGDLAREIKLHEREIRRLRVRMEQISAGGMVRATSVVGVLPSGNRPVEWWFNANLLGLGDELEPLEGLGVWISGSFVAGRSYYEIGAYNWISGSVSFYANADWFCDALELDLREEGGVWISGVCVGDRAVYHIGGLTEAEAVAAVEAANPLSLVGKLEIGDSNFYFVLAGGDPGVYFDTGDYMRYDRSANEFEFYIGASCKMLLSSTGLQVGTIVERVPGAGVTIEDVKHLDSFEEFTEIAAPANPVANKARFYAKDLAGITKPMWRDSAGTESDLSAGGQAGISGVDWIANGGWLGFGAAADLREAVGVWISGSFVAGEAVYEIGSYPAAASISGVDFEFNDTWFCWGQALNLLEGLGVWISGTCVAGEATYRIGAYDKKLSHSLVFAGLEESLTTGVLMPRPGLCVGESGEHGTFAPIRGKAVAGTAGVGTITIVIEADDNPAFSSPIVLYTLTLNAGTEVDDTTLDNAWAAGDIWVRARCTSEGTTKAKDVAVEFFFSEAVY